MKKTPIKHLYWLSMISIIFVLMCSIACIITLIIKHNECILLFGNLFGTLFMLVFVVIFTIMFICSIRKITIMVKDIKLLRNKEYISITAKVLSFKKNEDPESGVQINDRPIVLRLDTGEILELSINDEVMIGETYKFNYLRHSKIAEVVETINDKR